jgi:hypothetical protein
MDLCDSSPGLSGGNLTRSELQQSVIAGGGTADALYDQLDTNGTGSVSESQMAGQLATPIQSDNFGDALSACLNASGESQQALMQRLMGIGLTQDQTNSLSQQMQSAGLPRAMSGIGAIASNALDADTSAMRGRPDIIENAPDRRD